VENYISKGEHQRTLLGIENANGAAINAGLPLPDFSDVMRERRKNKLDLAMEK
jgi:hypothetical protein